MYEIEKMRVALEREITIFITRKRLFLSLTERNDFNWENLEKSWNKLRQTQLKASYAIENCSQEIVYQLNLSQC